MFVIHVCINDQSTHNLLIKPFELYLILLLHAHTWRRNCLSFRSTWVHLLYLAGFRLPDLWFSVFWLQIIVCLLSFFFGPLYCLFFLDLWLLIIPFVSSNCSCEHRMSPLSVFVNETTMINSHPSTQRVLVNHWGYSSTIWLNEGLIIASSISAIFRTRISSVR
jgi:hypothetical protein